MGEGSRDYKPGERVPGTVYLVRRTIGAGGMGTVYDVEDTTIGKLYVLKTLHPQLGDREDLARRMQAEARTLARLHHPNIVEVITAGVTGDDMKLPYYVMERLDGHSLRYVLDKGGQLELSHAYHIAIDLCDALDHAHDKGVIHRDVKPDNIFLHRTSAGITVTKLLDFGIMSLLDARHRETGQRFLGTLRYAAPEQLRGDKPTARMDVYAAALVLFEMVAGRGPFDDEGDPSKVGAAHMHKPAPLLSHFVVVPRELDALVNAALSKLPEHRPRDAFSLAASLRNLKKAHAASSHADTPGHRAPAPAPQVRPSSPPRPQVASPGPARAPAPQIPTPPASAVQSVPRTTVKGMPAPTGAATFASTPSEGPTATSASLAEALAPTVPQTPPAPQARESIAPAPYEGLVTVPSGFAPTYPSEPPPAVQSVAPIRWPVERPAPRTEEPQVRSVRSDVPEPPSRASLAVAVLGVFTVLFLVFVAVVAHDRLTPRASRTTRPGAAVVAATPPPPAPLPVVTMPAPTLAPPGLDEPVAASAPAPAVMPSAASPRITTASSGAAAPLRPASNR